MTDRRRRRAAVMATAVVVAALLAACGSDGGATGPAARPRVNGSQTTDASGNFPAVDEPVPTTGTGTSGSAALNEVAVRAVKMASLDAPTALATRPGSNTLYVTERAGRIRAVTVAGNQATVAAEPVLDLTDEVSTDGEQGLLGLAFSADGATAYVSFTNRDGDTRLVSYALIGDRVDTGSRRQLLAVDQPFVNHNGGNVELGPDGFLYFGLGDGGSANDPANRAQNPEVLLGKMLRIDPNRPGSNGVPYAIPTGNPYRNGGGRPEIFLSGVRNPWRFSFDRVTGDLWIGDVGQDAIEEIDYLPKGTGAGVNLGWSRYEGTQLHIPDRAAKSSLPPIFETSHDDGNCSVIGGIVYRGKRIPGLTGAYVYGDYCKPDLEALHQREGVVVEQHPLGVQVPALVSVEEDVSGEIWLVSLSGGLYRLEPA